MPKTLICKSVFSGKTVNVFVQQPDGFDVYANDVETSDSQAQTLAEDTPNIADLQERQDTGYVFTEVKEMDDAELAELVDGMHKGTPQK
jgi:hypothetical protein